MTHTIRRWTPETVREESHKYTSHQSFRRGSPGAYKAAVRFGILDSLGEHVSKILKRWTPENILEESKKYSSRVEFQKANGSAYQAASRIGLLDTLGDNMSLTRTYWTPALVLEESLKYKSRSSFQKGNGSAYKAARTLGIMESLGEHMNLTVKYWGSDKDVYAEAAKYSFRKDFEKGAPGAYNAARQRNIIEQACQHMEVIQHPWTDEEIRAEALLFEDRQSFKKGSTAAKAAYRRGILDSVCEHMKEKQAKIPWTEELIQEYANKYSTRKEFSDKCNVAYCAARARKIVGKVCAHMKIPKEQTAWTEEMLQEVALKFQTRRRFWVANCSAYSTAKNRGILDKICSHMSKAPCGFDINKPAVVYYIRFDKDGISPVYKIGVTNVSAADRLMAMQVKPGVTPKILREIWFERGKEALATEKAYHEEYYEQRYLGEPLLANGNTELFYRDVLGYDT